MERAGLGTNRAYRAQAIPTMDFGLDLRDPRRAGKATRGLGGSAFCVATTTATQKAHVDKLARRQAWSASGRAWPAHGLQSDPDHRPKPIESGGALGIATQI